jgi:transcriptional antiterminator RfaH
LTPSLASITVLSMNVKQWFVVHTQVRQELLALQHLEEQHFKVYLPRFKKIRSHARKVDEILVPLFPRYLFVGIDPKVDQWRSVNGTRGVSYVLTAEGQPLWVSTSIVDDLKSRENTEGLLSVDSLALFTTGDVLRVKEGSFEGQTGIFEKWTDRQRVQILLHFLGRELRVSVPAYTVEVF